MNTTQSDNTDSAPEITLEHSKFNQIRQIVDTRLRDCSELLTQEIISKLSVPKGKFLNGTLKQWFVKFQEFQDDEHSRWVKGFVRRSPDVANSFIGDLEKRIETVHIMHKNLGADSPKYNAEYTSLCYEIEYSFVSLLADFLLEDPSRFSSFSRTSRQG